MPSFRSSERFTSPTSTSSSTCWGYTSIAFRIPRASAYSDRLARMISEFVASSGMMSNGFASSSASPFVLAVMAAPRAALRQP